LESWPQTIDGYEYNQCGALKETTKSTHVESTAMGRGISADFIALGVLSADDGRLE
jgi:hypothetical protein